ncbi:metal-dependent protein hydrolase [Coccomyxa subellipsoidea C-169]|uniref:Metal-dependent protein hydrolase n=1 Tax=Coccomyxa subellipsoidea (strain C-169) TaxID=574566 RepID=I0YK59_COCSC|nr:metal-dependent protein hydrolase [Coccomyxa subellipsoidea C-169]EIE18778.1 metal-dependent protein hydrolase [Coccomyxa subellipsoidea C-169]|eukprot:XP_005643322.1 metal-dependent protein hydrolase [Coccomyxa subellipsoidea C-169]
MVRSSASSEVKRKMVKIGTHNGSFHCDEALGCFLLKRTDHFKDADIVRTRDEDILKQLDIVIDVGGKYDPDACRFDHHQRGFAEVFGHGFQTKLSSAGLVYKHFGRDIIAKLLESRKDHEQVEKVYLAVYKHFMEAIDAIDNGINQWDVDTPPKYMSTTNLSSRVGALNPRWNEDQSSERTDEQFLKAVQLTGSDFLDSVDYISKAWLPARTYVQEAIEKRSEVDSSGEIIRLPRVCPWKEHLYDLEQELALDKPLKFCIYEDDRAKSWRVQAVSVAAGSFENRKSLPAAWMGLRDAELSEAAGIPDCVFVHASGFIGGTKTLEGAIRMAQAGLKLP